MRVTECMGPSIRTMSAFPTSFASVGSPSEGSEAQLILISTFADYDSRVGIRGKLVDLLRLLMSRFIIALSTSSSSSS